MLGIIDKIRKNSLLVKNIGYLGLLQGVNILVPLITLPYLLYILGSEKYGLVVFAQAIASYFVILVSYGFNITGVKEVALNVNNKEKISEIVSSVYIIKGCFFVVSILGIFILTQISSTVNNNLLLHLLCMWICFYEFLFAEWYFQGLEKMKFITIFSSIFKVVFLCLIFLLVKDSDDYLLVPVVNGIGALISSFLCVYVIFVVHKVKFRMQKWGILKYYLKESFPIFAYRSSQVYIKLNKVLLGVFVGFSEVAYYDLAEKVVNVMRMPIGILGQAVFPKNVKERNKGFIRKMFSYVFGVNFIMLIFIGLIATKLCYWIGGDEMIGASNILRLLALTLIPVTFNSLFASQTLLIHGHNKKYMWSIMTAGFVYVMLVLTIYYYDYWSIYSIGAAVLISECTTATLAYYYMNKYNLIH